LRPAFASGAYRRYVPVAAYAAILVALAFATRVALLARADVLVEMSAATLLQVFGVGLFFDLVAAAYFCAPFVLYLALLPERAARWKPHTWVFLTFYLAFTYLLVVVAVAEWVFWDEFAARFNFIAVDYLVYTSEVLGNIWQSYPVGQWLAWLAIPAILVWLPLRRVLADALAHPAPVVPRLATGFALLLLPALALVLVNTRMKELSGVDAVNELAGNGIYEFFAANYNNQLSYARFYATLPPEQAMRTARRLVGGATPRWIGTTPVGMHRELADAAPDKRLNVVLVSIESLGTEFLGSFGNPEGLTPRLDALGAESLSFTQLYATGNRTVRGMEALALSLPPTPGQSIVKRPNNEGLFTLGSVFKDHGFDVAYLYGGYGYFDNLNYFFGNNDYRVIDRTAIDSRDVHHETIWGVADEDLFTLALREMDRSKLAGGGTRPFFMHIMTTSNHRPYTYPTGRIDIPSGSGRSGAVKYTDFAVGQFLDEAKKHPWFADTVFLITADHGASARGTTQIPVLKYRVPLFVYSPKHVRPGRYDRLMSQIDIGPTLLGLLDMDYSSKFFGRDVFKVAPGEERALVGNYQTLGYMKDGRLVTLQPQRKVSVTPLPADLGLPPPTGIPADTLRDEAISLYQAAALVYDGGLQKREAQSRSLTRAALTAPAAPPR
jgi:phosphoglycerol transferase MdoB-like AlkP superfamily enzyme